MKPTLPHTAQRLIILAAALAVAGQAWSCTVSTSGLVFGSYSLFDPMPTDSTAEIVVDCAAPYSISLDPGTYGSFAARAMAGDGGGGDRLYYNLYTGPSFSVVWGDGSQGTATVGGPGSSEPARHAVHGRIPAGQNARVGGYSDPVIILIEF
jgi:spore coat protein U-like protein